MKELYDYGIFQKKLRKSDAVVMASLTNNAKTVIIFNSLFSSPYKVSPK